MVGLRPETALAHPTSDLNIQVAHVQRVLLDEVAAGFDMLAHQHAEDFITGGPDFFKSMLVRVTNYLWNEVVARAESGSAVTKQRPLDPHQRGMGRTFLFLRGLDDERSALDLRPRFHCGDLFDQCAGRVFAEPDGSTGRESGSAAG